MNIKKVFKPKNFFFFNHKRYDTGTFSIVFSSMTFVLILFLFLLTFAYSFPKCFCEDPYPHFRSDLLPTGFIPIYICLLLVLFFGLVVCGAGIYGVYKARKNLVFSLLVLQIVTSLFCFLGSIMIIKWMSDIDQYILISNTDYMSILELVIKPEIFTAIKDTLDSFTTLFAAFIDSTLKLDSGTSKDSLNLNTLMESVLHEQVLSLMQGMKLVMKCGVILCCIATNFAYFSAVFTTYAHYKKLRKGGPFSSYNSAIPGCLINSAVMTSSARSTATILTPRHDKFEPLDYVRPPSEKYHTNSRSSRHNSRRNQYRRSEKSVNSRPSRRENGSSYVTKRDYAPRTNGSIHSSAAYSKRSSKSSSAGHHSDRSRKRADPVDKYPHDQYL